MENRIEDIQYCEKLFDRFYDVGSTEDGGVTRLGYSEQEDEMHAVFSDLAKELDCTIFHDEVGNTYASNSSSGDYYLVGSHMDSVIEGGRRCCRYYCRSHGNEMGKERRSQHSFACRGFPL